MNFPNPSRITKAASLAVLLISGGANADVVKMANGDRITGTLGNITGGNVTVTTAYAGDVIIGMANVVDIETDSVYDVTLNDGDKVSGKLVADGLLVNGNVRPTRIGDIHLLAPQPTGAPVWTSRIDAFASFSNGNADTQAISILGNSIYTAGRNEHRLSVYVGDEEADSQTTKEQIEIDYNYRRYLRDDWYYGGQAEYFRDALKMVDSRYTVGATIGKQFWNNPLGAFSAEAGISAVFEDLDGDNVANPAVRAALAYNRLLTPKIELFSTAEVLAILDSDRGQIYNSQTGVRFLISDSLSANIRYDLRHETDPPAGAEKTDTTFAVGVGYAF